MAAGSAAPTGGVTLLRHQKGPKVLSRGVALRVPSLHVSLVGRLDATSLSRRTSNARPVRLTQSETLHSATSTGGPHFGRMLLSYLAAQVPGTVFQVPGTLMGGVRPLFTKKGL